MKAIKLFMKYGVKISNKLKKLIFTVIVTFCSLQIIAGGISIDPNTVRMNGYNCGTSFSVGERILMSYNAKNYSFSGGDHQFQYYIFRLSKVK